MSIFSCILTFTFLTQNNKESTYETISCIPYKQYLLNGDLLPYLLTIFIILFISLLLRTETVNYHTGLKYVSES